MTHAYIRIRLRSARTRTSLDGDEEAVEYRDGVVRCSTTEYGALRSTWQTYGVRSTVRSTARGTKYLDKVASRPFVLWTEYRVHAAQYVTYMLKGSFYGTAHFYFTEYGVQSTHRQRRYSVQTLRTLYSSSRNLHMYRVHTTLHTETSFGVDVRIYPYTVSIYWLVVVVYIAHVGAITFRSELCTARPREGVICGGILFDRNHLGLVASLQI